MSRTLKISKDSVINRTRRLSHAEALTEYVVNGLDAGATRIDINYQEEGLGGISTIEVIDNGSGIVYENLTNTFEVFGASQKNTKKTKSNTTGKNGIGRLCFYKFSMNASWETVYKSFEDKNMTYLIHISAGLVNEYDPTEPVQTTNNTGTKVTFKNIQAELASKEYFEAEFMTFLRRKLAWRLELTKAEIYVNGALLNYDSIIQLKKTDSIVLHHDENDQDFTFEIVFIKRDVFMKGEESRYYFISTSNQERYKCPTGLNKNNDEFYHSVYVRSSYFDSFEYIENDQSKDGSHLFNQNGTHTQKDKFFGTLKNELRKYLEQLRKPFLKKKAEDYVKDLEGKQIFENGDSMVTEYKNQTIKDTIQELYVINPSIVKKLNDTQKKIFFRMMGTILEEGESTKLFDILDHILNLTEEEREKFAEILQNIHLRNIIKTIDLIKDRFETLSILEQFVLNEELNADEETDLQNLISDHYRIFGEEYALLGDAEEDFIANLRKFHYLLTGEKITRKEANIDSEHKNKELDILMCKVEVSGSEENSRMKNIIVELKHPKINLGQKEHTQVINYFQTILKEPRFNGTGFEWKFYLVGNTYNAFIETLLRGNEAHGRDVILRDPQCNYTIYCKKRSDVILECKTRLEFLRKKLDVSYQNISKNSKILSVEEGTKRLENSAVEDNSVEL